MFTHPDLLPAMAKQHAHDLREQATRHRLAAALRRGRRQLWPDSRTAGWSEATKITSRENVGHVGTLASCEGPAPVTAAARAR